MISNKTKELIWTLKENEHMNNTQISKRVGVSRGKVIEILRHPEYRNAQLNHEINKIQQQHNDTLLNIIQKDDRLPSIANKILNLMNNDEMLEKEIERNGLRALATVLGILSDKAIKVTELNKNTSTEDNVTVKIINNAPDISNIELEDKDEININ